MEKFANLILICTIINLSGMYITYLYGKNTKKFKWGEYIALISSPIIGVIIMIIEIDIKILYLFLISMVCGTFAEYSFGLAYDKTLNKKLWVYKRYSISGYTSYLSIPIWGVAGVIFYSISKMIGL